MLSAHNNRKWLIAAIAISTGALLVLMYIFLGGNIAKTTDAQNAARSSTLRSDISLLPSVSTIIPAQTSGTLDYVVTSRQSIKDGLTDLYSPVLYPLFFVALPSYRVAEAQIAFHKAELSKLETTLHTTSTDLRELKKFIEYMPLVDLAGEIDSDPSRDIRLERTYAGLETAASYIKGSQLERRNQIQSMVTELNKQTKSLNDATKADWALLVKDAQVLVVEDIAAADIQMSKYEEVLKAIEVSYQ